MTETPTLIAYDVLARCGNGWRKIDVIYDPLDYGNEHVRFRAQENNMLYRVTEGTLVADAMIVDTRK